MSRSNRIYNFATGLCINVTVWLANLVELPNSSPRTGKTPFMETSRELVQLQESQGLCLLQSTSEHYLRFIRYIQLRNAKMFFRPSLLILLLSIVAARPVVQTRDVKANGPAGTLSQTERWADAVGTATAPFMNGAVRKNSVLHSSPTGPLSEVYHDVLRGVLGVCKAGDGLKCELAVNGFGGVGEVIYNFTNLIENVQGRSTQVLVACRCVGEECNTAVLIRPVNVLEKLTQSPNEKPLRKTCIYEAVENEVGNGFTDCHAELLRIVRRPIGRRLEYTHGSDAFVYTVNDTASQSKWTAQGQRGWTRDCPASDVNSLPTVTMADLRNIQQNTHTTLPNNNCTPPDNVQYFQEAGEAAGEACYATYEYAAAAASQFASQQDGFAIGLRQESYLDSKPALVSNTELALTCSAAGLGVLVLWGIHRTKRENANHASIYLFRVIMVQLLSYALESLPLHIALGQELRARAWESEFTNVGASVALSSDQLGPQGSAAGSVLVMTAVFGTVKYQLTRVSLVAGFTATFDLVAFGIIVATLLTSRRPRPHAGVPQASQPARRFDGWVRFMRGYPARQAKEEVVKRAELEARLQQLQMQNFGRHAFAGSNGWNGNASVGMSSGSTTVTSESSAGLSDTPVTIDIGGGVVPPVGHGVHSAEIAAASPTERTNVGGDGPQSSQGSIEEVETGNDDPNIRN